MLKKLVLFILTCFPIALLAQNNTLTGNIFDNDNRATIIEGATIKNLNTKAFALSDKDGHFAISAKIGDLVSFSMFGYQADTLYLVKLFPKNVYLRLQINSLNAVDINSTKISPYLDVKDPNAIPARQVDYSKERGGLRLNLGFGKYRKEQVKVQELEENERMQKEITKNFNEEYIRSLVKFEGDGIKDFIGLYRPTVEQVKSENPFNYAYYTARAYQVWLKLPADQRRLPPLTKLKAN